MAEGFAMMLANNRGAKSLEIVDILAGIYITNFERLDKYWSDSEIFETFVEDHCHIDRERWFYWFEYCEQVFHGPRPWSLGRYIFRRRSKWSFVGKFFKRSPNLEAAYRTAEELTPTRSPHPFSGKELPVITSECLLLSIARQTDLDISHRLRESGLDIQELEKAVRFPKQEPRL